MNSKTDHYKRAVATRARDLALAKVLIEAATTRYGFNPSDITSPMRFSDMCEARYAIAYILKSSTNLSLRSIAKTLGRSDHTTTLGALKHVNEDPDRFNPIIIAITDIAKANARTLKASNYIQAEAGVRGLLARGEGEGVVVTL